MGQELNIQMNKFNGTDYDIMYPQTKIELVQGLTSSVVCTIVPALAGVTVTLTRGAYVYSGVSNSSGVAIINVGIFGTYAITFDNPSVVSVPTIDIQFYGVYPITAQVTATYTVRIDETNSNPETALVYQDDAIGMTKGSSDWDNKEIFNAIKPCVFQNGGVNYYLNPNDYTKKIDGTPSVLTGADGDVMVEFSKFAYRIYREGNYLYVSVSNNSNVIAADSRFRYLAFSRTTEGDKDKMYIGAYHGYTISSKLRSVSGQSPTVNQNIGTFRTQAQANGVGYQQFTFYQLTALQCLYIIKYGNLNSQSALGIGWTNKSAATQTGGANTRGLYYGDQTGNQIKFAGIEDFYGNVYDWIDGLYSDANRNILTGFSGYNDSGSGYVNNGQGATANISGYISKTQGINSNAGFIVKETNGSATTYYSDYGYLYASYLPFFGGYWSNGSDAGAFQLNVSNSASIAHAYLGARLSFC